jgi:hypothetical protein
MPQPHRVFLLSPANLTGKRAGYLLHDGGGSPVAARLRNGTGATVGEVFSLVSGLYFRGKLAYALAFATPPAGFAGVQVIVPGRGLWPHDTRLDIAELRRIARVRVDPRETRFTAPLVRDATRLAAALGGHGQAVLLGSIATTKYLDPLAVLGPRLAHPEEFVGRGDMSRGALLLRCCAARRELIYTVSLHGEVPARAGR